MPEVLGCSAQITKNQWSETPTLLLTHCVMLKNETTTALFLQIKNA